MKKIFLLSLGCPRNMLDSEVLLGLLAKKGYMLVDEAESADIAVINTCGFIKDAKEESIEAILSLAELKNESKISKLIVTGCLSQRYPENLMDEISEIDAIFGTSDFTRIPEMLEDISNGKKYHEVNKKPDFIYDHNFDRKLLTKKHFAYIKIQEGCSNRCSYCIIPNLKGIRRSRDLESVLSEITAVKKQTDLKEIVLIGQDTTSFGKDFNDDNALIDLLSGASKIMEDGWVRLLYTHPAHFTSGLVEMIASTDNICNYIDLPVQHINNRLLRNMNRKTTKEEITSLIINIRSKIPNVILRTSVIVGFPGETEEEFNELLQYIKEIKFDRLGAFIYSREEGTPAYEYVDQIPQQLKMDRFDKVMKLQQTVSLENNMKFMDKKIPVLIDEEDPDSQGHYIGRSYMDAPEVDGVVFVKGKKLKTGDFVNVKITGTLEYDLIGECE